MQSAVPVPARTTSPTIRDVDRVLDNIDDVLDDQDVAELVDADPAAFEDPQDAEPADAEPADEPGEYRSPLAPTDPALGFYVHSLAGGVVTDPDEIAAIRRRVEAHAANPRAWRRVLARIWAGR